ncbi:homocitrate synthase [Clostridium sp. Mt-5]|uniref:Homocitrate synthase n=1 Tax=Clostridium moutaii TaxID=3240932 RepID=A0ABV4BUN4_9CLOT
MDVKIVDTTLREGEQKACIALGINEKVRIAKLINDMGIYQIEAGSAAMGGYEKESIKKIAGLGLKSRISSWNRANIKDIDASIDCGVDIIHISIPTSDLQISSKLGKDKKWVLNSIKKCAAYALHKGFEVTIGMEDATRSDINFLIELCGTVSEMGIKRVRYSDTVGISYPRKIFYNIKKLMQEVPVEIEIHTHNDFGMALANSLGAAEAGAKFVDCTVTGIGERAGNCDFLKFMQVLNVIERDKLFSENFSKMLSMENEIRKMI